MALAARGQRETDTGTESIAEAAVAAGLRRQAAGVHLRSLGTAVVLTALSLLP